MNVTIISPGVYTYGSMLIGGILREKGYDVELTRDLRAGSDTVLMSLYSTLHLHDPAIREFVERNRNKKIYVGGPVSAYPEMVLGELPGVSAVIVGEGEETTPELLEGENPDSIDGICFRDGDNIVKTGRRKPADMKRPLPLIPHDIGNQQIRGANVYIEIHRGCHGSCGFCQVPEFFGRNIRSRDPEDIIEETKAFVRAGAKKIAISGGTSVHYRMDDDEFIELLRRVSGIVGPRNLATPDVRIDAVNEKNLGAIREYTMGWVFYGIETGSDRLLKIMHKGINTEQVRRAVELTRSLGVHAAGTFMVGYIGETEEDVALTNTLLEELELEDMVVGIAEPIHTTSLSGLAIKTPIAENPNFYKHKGKYTALNLTESEARRFDLTLSGLLSRPISEVITNNAYDRILAETKMMGKEVRDVTNLIRRYYG